MKIEKVKFNIFYMLQAHLISRMSYGVRAKCGCVIVKDKNIISFGYNGMPTGFDNCCEIEENGQLVTKKEVLHAEANALMKLISTGQFIDDNTSLYVTMSPCIDCAKLIHQSGIKYVYYDEKYRNDTGIKFLESNNNIHVKHFPLKDILKNEVSCQNDKVKKDILQLLECINNVNLFEIRDCL